MSKLNHIEESVNRTGNGSIDYRYYENRARNIRGSEVMKSMKNLFSGKKNS